MKLINKFLGFGIACGAMFGFAACTNELNEQPNVNGGLGGIRLAKSADITAWSGNQFLSPGTPITKGEDIVKVTPNGPMAYGAYYPENKGKKWDDKFKTTLPDTYADLTASNQDQNYFNNASNWVVPETFGSDGGAVLTIPQNVQVGTKDIYILGHVTKFEGFQNAGEVNLYIFEDGQLDDFGPSTGNIKVYNAGELTITDDSVIKDVYNKGILNFGITDIYANHITLYSQGGIINLLENTDLKCFVEIHNMVYCDGNLNVQNDKDQYICGLYVKGDLNIDTDLTSSYIISEGQISVNGDNIFLTDGGHLKAKSMYFHSDGHIEDEGEVEAIKSYHNTPALVEVEQFEFQNDKLGNHLGENVYAKFETIKYKEGGQETTSSASEYTDDKLDPKYINNKEIYGVPECGEAWTTRDDGQIPGLCEKGCGHPAHDGDECDRCLKEGKEDSPCYPGDSSQGGEGDICENGCEHPKHTGRNCDDPSCNNPTCNPCPNHDDEEEGSGCEHSGASHHPDGNDNTVCDECIEKGVHNDCNPETSTTNPNPDPDGCFNKGKPGYGDGCEHDHNTSYCPDCEKDGGPCKQPETPAAKGSPKSEVEVNLSILDQHKQYKDINELVAKLSIHIRNGEDVEIFIPITDELYCQTDDLYILKDHNLGNFVHGGAKYDDDGNLILNTEQVTYTIAGNPVTLTVTYTSGENGGKNGITITTDGMNDEIFDYLKREFGDGLNFEVWLYLNDGTDLEFDDFHEILDQATIEFLENDYPDYYINAFNDTTDNPEGKKDCTVSIVDGQQSQYGNAKEDFHLNGSKYNKIYKNKDFTDGPEGVHDHHFLWDYYNPSTNNSGNQ